MICNDRFRKIYRIESSRLKDWDYSQAGKYFVTICTREKLCYFENPLIKNICHDCWLDIPNHFNNVRLGEWIIMPNHVHGIIEIRQYPIVETPYMASLHKLTKRTFGLINASFYKTISRKSHHGLPQIIQSFKSAVSRQCHKLNLAFFWQTRFYDHIIHDEKELYLINEYIKDNPKNWKSDRNNIIG